MSNAGKPRSEKITLNFTASEMRMLECSKEKMSMLMEDMIVFCVWFYQMDIQSLKLTDLKSFRRPGEKKPQ